MKGITVGQLTAMCLNQMRAGHGDKEILISSDDEGNEYHTLFFGFTDDIQSLGDIKEMSYFHDGQDINDIVILG